jgi:hypothetical protein
MKSLSRIGMGVLVAAGLMFSAPVPGVGDLLAPGAYADQAKKQKRTARRQSREYALERGASPEEIARYFALHGGNIDPYLNRQTPGGPFDSGFFFDSGVRPNGGNSPYMN